MQHVVQALSSVARILLAPAWKTRGSRCNPEEGKKDPRKVLEDLVRADADNNSHLVNATQPTHGENKHETFSLCSRH